MHFSSILEPGWISTTHPDDVTEAASDDPKNCWCPNEDPVISNRHVKNCIRPWVNLPVYLFLEKKMRCSNRCLLYIYNPHSVWSIASCSCFRAIKAIGLGLTWAGFDHTAIVFGPLHVPRVFLFFKPSAVCKFEHLILRLGLADEMPYIP